MATNKSSLANESTREKEVIKSHPLFPLLEYLFFKCERATSKLNRVHTNLEKEDIMKILSRSSDVTNSTRSGNDETDELMFNAIHVLRVQLLELEKVDELCEDFCSRYIACLKGKVTQEMLLGWSDIGDDDSCSSPPSSTQCLFNPNLDELRNELLNNSSSAVVATMQTPNGQVSIPLVITTPCVTSASPTSPPGGVSMSAAANAFETAPNLLLDCAAIKSGPTGGFVNGPASSSSSSNVTAQRTTDCNNVKNSHSGERVSRTWQLTEESKTQVRKQGAFPSACHRNGNKGKRGSLPRGAVEDLRGWLFRNMRHPYPSEDEKRDLCERSGLNLLQVNNWFINARRRILQPLLDGVVASSVQNSSCPEDTRSQNSVELGQHLSASAASCETVRPAIDRKRANNSHILQNSPSSSVGRQRPDAGISGGNGDKSHSTVPETTANKCVSKKQRFSDVEKAAKENL